MEPLGIDLVLESAEVQANVVVTDPDEASVDVQEVPEGPFLLIVDAWSGNGWY